MDKCDNKPPQNQAEKPQIELYFFGALGDLGGLGDQARDFQKILILQDELFSDGELTAMALIDYIGQRAPELALALRAPGIRLAINKRLCPLSSAVQSGDEVAFMSPLSGG